MTPHVEGEACRPDNIRCGGPHVERDFYAEAQEIVNRLRIFPCEHLMLITLCKVDLEAEIASLLRKIEIAKAK